MQNQFATLSTLYDKVRDEYTTFNNMKIETIFVDNKSLSLAQRLTNTEKFLDQIEEKFLRRQTIIQSYNNILEKLDELTKQLKSNYNEVSKQSEIEKAYEVFNLQILLIEEQYKNKIEPFEEQIQIINNEKASIIDEIRKSKMYSMYLKTTEPPVIITQGEKESLEILLNQKITNVLFDSTIDDWSLNSSVFSERVLNKSNLCVLIEDTNHNKFGGVFNGEISDIGHYHNGGESFLFSLVRNGTLNPKKFRKSNNYSFYEMCCYEQNSKVLFSFGFYDDICVYKKGIDKNFCKPCTFTAKQNELTDNDKFVTKSIIINY
ncbi:hypothetical protein EIN_360860, partial [Entamoeba invadens IP1]